MTLDTELANLADDLEEALAVVETIYERRLRAWRKARAAGARCVDIARASRVKPVTVRATLSRAAR